VSPTHPGRRRRPLTPTEQLHADWLGMLQPEGLVVSIPVLVEMDAYVRQPGETQDQLRALVPAGELDRAGFDRLLAEVLGWSAQRIADAAALDAMGVPLPELGVVLRPDAALVDNAGAPLVFVAWSPGELDAPVAEGHWPISRQGRFERLLLESQGSGGPTPSGPVTGTPIGLHACPTELRLTYAPRGEAPGSLTFPLDALCTWDGRVLVDALCMLLGRHRLFTVPAEQRLLPLLRASRQRQEKVTEELASQVEEALQILVAGLDVANDRMDGALLRGMSAEEGAAEVRAGLVAVLLRLVFLLYCEDQGVLPAKDNPFYLENYSIARLADQLQEERVLYPEAMRHRYGAWARLCALFRLVWAGARHRDLLLPPRQGSLFDPGAHPFLEGRASEHTEAAETARAELPPIDDGVVDEVLDRLVYLEGQRISYRNLDVEQIGSVYEALMGLELRRAGSRALPLRGGAWVELGDVVSADQPASVLANLTGMKPAEITRRLPGLSSWTPTGSPRADEASLEALLAPLVRPDVEPRKNGQHYITAGTERRRTGSHYTPTSLTRPIVERTLGPVLDRDGPPSSARILAMKVCDPAMGSGAFLAEACRYLARRLLDAWAREGKVPAEARASDPLLVARRMVAERCLYGVDKNPFAVQIARLSLWLVTLAKALPFTFVDHALREGDAVIGLSAAQIGAFSFAGAGAGTLYAHAIRKSIKDAVRDRAQILEPDLFSWRDKTRALTNADDEVYTARRRGDLMLAAYWAGGSEKELKKRLQWLHPLVDTWFLSDGDDGLDERAEALLAGLPMRPFHWELEFPEVFARENPGFDAVVGNPPFGGENNIRQSNGGAGYIDLLQRVWEQSHGKSDLCAYFFRRTQNSIRRDAAFGLVATNTIAQGVTRETGLQFLLASGVSLYDATTNLAWPVGGASVVVDVVHGWSGSGLILTRLLNAQPVGTISSFLTSEDEMPDPLTLEENQERSFIGCVLHGEGFVLTPPVAAALLHNSEFGEVVRPYVAGAEVNRLPTESPQKWIINFDKRDEDSCRSQFPGAFEIVERLVRPERMANSRENYRRRWWQLSEPQSRLYQLARRLPRVLIMVRATKYPLLAFRPSDHVFSDGLVVFLFADWFAFAVLQSRLHEAWAWSFSTTMKTDLRYTPTRVFQTFPLPRPTDAQRNAVAAAGQALYEHRSMLMLHFNEGMTKIWNRLLDDEETDLGVLRLRELRDTMDRAVLDAYGWPELAPDDTAAIVRNLRALNAERAAEEKRRG
jgi:hypothetical protein